MYDDTHEAALNDWELCQSLTDWYNILLPDSLFTLFRLMLAHAMEDSVGTYRNKEG